MERRALRRAADQALLTSLANSTPGQPGGAPDQDFEYRWSELGDTVASYDYEPTTEPIPVADVREVVDHEPWAGVQVPLERDPVDVYDLVPDQPDHAGDVDEVPAFPEQRDDDRWDDYEGPMLAPAPVRPPLRARPPAEAAMVPALAFALPERQPWYRTKPAAAVLVAAVIAAVVCAGWLVFRGPTTSVEQSSVEAPTSAPPAPTKAQPTAVSAPKPQPAPPPPPPPPPPPAESTYSAPQRQYSEPGYRSPEPAEKPRVDVTRAPMSVAPVPRPVEGSDSNTPGDAPGEKPRRRGCFGFC